MAKKITAIFLFCIFSMYNICFAHGDIIVRVNGQVLDFDVQPQIMNDRTMVPMRKIFNELGADVEWIDNSQAIIATKNNLIITMQINSEAMNVTNILTREVNNIILDSPPVIVDSRTLVPVRAISEGLNMEVSWNDATSTVSINAR